MTQASTSQTQGAHGGEIFRIARESGVTTTDIHDFSSNANSLCHDLTDSILTAIPQGERCGYTHYPDTACTELAQALALHEAVAEHEIIVGNGSTENIFLTFQQLAPKNVLLIGPMFSEYQKACEIFARSYDVLPCSSAHNFSLHPADLAHTAQYDLVVLCSPNNPATITYPNMAEILRAIHSPYVLIDSTYREFLYGTPTYDATHIARYRAWCNPETHIITTHSLTKFFYCTGIRLGYSISDGETTARLRTGKMPWSVTTYAQKAGLAFLQHIDAYRSRIPALRENQQQFADAIRACGVFQPDLIFCGVNFLFCKLCTPEDGERLYSYLLTKRILVRLCDNIPGTEKGFIRMQVRTPEEWQPLIAALTEWKAAQEA
ncbi:MAG: aminotransferase class I/II-fold pyridoxal phosphate-dependent enzyme [Desulfovibrionales bacterium]|nr:aminotransferase class I/II-fold pyridoxal phosphate-dependent enzyme [Desulfovibrionales bacterium]